MTMSAWYSMEYCIYRYVATKDSYLLYPVLKQTVCIL